MPTFAIAAFVAAVAVTAMKERKWSRLERECRVPAEATVVSVRTDRVGFPLVRTTRRTYFAARTRMGSSTFVVDHPWRFYGRGETKSAYLDATGFEFRFADRRDDARFSFDALVMTGAWTLSLVSAIIAIAF